MQLIGNETDPRLNLPENMTRPICLTTSLNAVLYLPRTSGSFNGNPPSFQASGWRQSSILSFVLKFFAKMRIVLRLESLLSSLDYTSVPLSEGVYTNFSK
jgi:hypothetical protein